MQFRSDGLPEPVTVEQMFLAAILDRLPSVEDRAPGAPAPITEPAAPVLVNRPVLAEPAAPAPDDLITEPAAAPKPGARTRTRTRQGNQIQ